MRQRLPHESREPTIAKALEDVLLLVLLEGTQADLSGVLRRRCAGGSSSQAASRRSTRYSMPDTDDESSVAGNASDAEDAKSVGMDVPAWREHEVRNSDALCVARA